MNKDWFIKRNLKVLNYQNITIDKTSSSLIINTKTVLGACPSAGKTTITIYIVEEYLKANPTHNVTILTHGTTILRSQFHNELISLKPDFTFDMIESYSEYQKSEAQVIVTLPQTLNQKDIKPTNLIIIDEAHHFYFAQMVKDIISKSNATKQLLLTGTPSKFIYENLKLKSNEYNIIPVTIETIFDEGMASNTIIEVASSTYDFDITKDFDRKNNLRKPIFDQFDTEKTLDDLLEKIINRLRSFKNTAYINYIPTWSLILKDLEKTMFACQSIKQATQVYDYLKNKNINCVISTSKDDLESTEINKFKTDDSVLVLIVVYRGILGFNYPKLTNVVDMTMSYNIDRVLQLFSRVLRVNNDNLKQQKMFFKISPMMLTDYYKHVMNAMLMLMSEEYFLKYNGKNFLDMEIPIKKVNSKNNESEEPKTVNSPKQKKYTPIDLDGVPVFDFFKNIWHTKGKMLSTYCLTTVREVKSEFTINKPRGYWTKEKCQEAASLCKNKKEFRENYPNEHSTASNNNWIDDICGHMIGTKNKPGYWTKEKCQEVASLCKTKTEFRKNKPAYAAAANNNWIDDICGHMIETIDSIGYWTKEKCQEAASLCKNKTEFRKNKKAYSAASRNNWIDDICGHMIEIKKPKGYWTKEKCQEAASLCKTKTEFLENIDAYNAAHRNNWIADICGHMIEKKKPNGYWTKEKCQEAASLCETKREFKQNKKAYSAARRNQWLVDICRHMIEIKKPKGYWTKEKCQEVASLCKTKTEFRQNIDAYNAAHRNNWIDDICGHMIETNKKPYGYWTKEKCQEAASLCKTKTEFQN